MTDDQPLSSPDPDRSGPTVDAAVEQAEEVPSGQAAPGESRVEQMPEVVDTVEDTAGED
jgi:hypothetical protein